ncbi:MAG: hypothetical protein LBM93_12940 [Oscillospiraceae bacterium]|jgi:hypothetical protein|nr:hypothetical protein [Oscillospiraceae bacterium]
MKNYKLINILSVSMVLVLGTAFLSFGNRPDYSETEKRDLAEFPDFSVKALLNGDFTKGVDVWFSDTVPNRTKFLNNNSDFKSYFGLKKDGVTIIDSGDDTQKPDKAVVTEIVKAPVEVVVPDVTSAPAVTTAPVSTTAATQAVVTTVETEEVIQHEAEGGVLSGNIIVYKNRGMPQFYGTLAQGTNYAAYINAFKADLGENVNVYSMVVPTAQTFYMPEKYLKECSSEPDQLTNIRNNLQNVIDINLVPTFNEHKDEDIYLRTDHHWGALGAFYAAEQFADIAQTNFLPLATFRKIEWDGYVGTLYGYSNNNPDLKNNPETFYAYEPLNMEKLDCQYYSTSYTDPVKTTLIWEDVSVSNAYISFMGGDEKINDIRTSHENGRTLAIFKDSYGNAIQPFLTNSFSRIITIDIRYFDLNAIQFLQEQNVTDVLFCMNTFSAFGSNSKKIEQIRTQ